jgi:iron complex outermembrane receptor protein
MLPEIRIHLVSAASLRSLGLLLTLSYAANNAFSESELELVRVTADKALFEDSSPFANSVTVLRADSSTRPPQDLSEILRQEPDVDYNGQGGLFQTVTIRGMGRQRIGSYFLDIPLLSDRRAGTAASFIDPVTIEAVELVRGPSSIVHGYGAIGGLVRIHPLTEEGLSAGLGWGGSANENLQYAAYGAEEVQLALVHRGADESKTAAGEPLNTGFDQYSANFALTRDYDDIRFSANGLVSYAQDIGKSNNRYPQQRISDYPRERHWLTQLALEQADDWRSSLFFHSQDLETRVEYLEQRLNEVDTSSFDFGGKLVLIRGTDRSPLRVGLDYLGRRNVDADEKETAFDTGQETWWTNLRAQQDDIAVFADLEYNYHSLQWAGGLRVAETWQSAKGFNSESEFYANAFSGVEWFANDSVSVSLQASAGQRPANLSERYFTGTTGRGSIVSEPELETEKVLGLDLGTSWELSSSALQLHGYYTRLNDLIERVEVAPDVLSFRNNREGNIWGAEATARHNLGNHWQLFVAGSYQDSEDDDSNALEDTAANRLSMAVQYGQPNWELKLQYEYRFSRGDVAPTETPVDSARLLSARLEYRPRDRLTVEIWGRNLLNDEYRISTDDLSTEGEERALGVLLTWRSR